MDGAAAERWFRRHGLPYLVPVRRWASELPSRVAPFLVLLAGADLFFAAFELYLETDDGGDVGLLLLLVAIVVVIGLLVPMGLALLAAWIIRRRPRAGPPIAIVMAAVLVVGQPVDAWLSGSALTPGELLLAGLSNLVVVAVAVALTWSGVGALLGWAVCTVFRQYARVARVAARTLPLVAVVVLLSVFSSPLWVAADEIDGRRAAAIVAFFLVLGLVFVTPSVWGEVAALQRALPADDDLAGHLRGTPAEGVRVRRPERVGPLAVRERVNIAATIVTSLVFQVAALAVLVFLTLLVFAWITLGPTVVERLVGHPPVPVLVFGVDTGIALPTLNIATFLAAFAGLQFVIQLGTNAAHRDSFYQPLLDNARQALTLRAVYLSEGTRGRGRVE